MSTRRRTYPDFAVFTSQFHPRFHTYKDHVRVREFATEECRYVLFVGRTDQGRSLVEAVLAEASLEMTRESNDPSMRKAMETIRTIASGLAADAVEAISRFEQLLAESIHKVRPLDVGPDSVSDSVVRSRACSPLKLVALTNGRSFRRGRGRVAARVMFLERGVP